MKSEMDTMRILFDAYGEENFVMFPMEEDLLDDLIQYSIAKDITVYEAIIAMLKAGLYISNM